MTYIAFFELKAKNLFQDYQTKTPYLDPVDGNTYYKYEPKHFDIDSIFCDFDCDEHNFSLIEAQDIIAYMVGFENWAELLNASESELELARLLFDNQDKIFIEDWKMDLDIIEHRHNVSFDSESRLEFFKARYVDKEIKSKSLAIKPVSHNKDSIAYFKLQAKNLFKDFKTTISDLNDVNDTTSNKHEAKYFDIESILVEYGCDKNKFSLMKAQHLIARMVGFGKWTDLLKASEAELALARLLFDNRDKIHIQHWKKYISGIEHDHGITLDDQERLAIFKHDYEVTFNGGNVENPFPDYRLNQDLVRVSENEKPQYS